MRKLINKESPLPKEKRFGKERKKYQEIWERVKPFIKERKSKQYSTAGRWESSDS